jgi:glycosyltransferase involved in cell wall biosynthesis
MYKLNICIPTYNRKEKVLSLLDFLLKEFEGKSYCITVRDNCSEDGTFDALSLSGYCAPNISIKKNDRNIGLGGNLKLLYEEDCSEFLWVVGDDDWLGEGIANYIFGFICKGGAGCYLINHQAIGENSKILFHDAYQSFTPSSNSLLPIFKERGSVMMFISSVVFRVTAIKELIEKQPDAFSPRLTLPLYMSLGVAELSGVEFLRRNSYLTNVHGETSWKDQAWKVFLIGVPSELFRVYILTRNTYPIFLCVEYIFKKAIGKFDLLRRRKGRKG